jgi:hypothetical protein
MRILRIIIEMKDYSYNRNSERQVAHTDAELCVNAWYFVDESGLVMRIAVKAYALMGTDEEKLAELRHLAATDHLTATMGNVPQNFKVILSDGELAGVVTHEHMQQGAAQVFDDLFSIVEAGLPAFVVSVNNEYVAKCLKLEEPILWVCTPVLEREDGILLAQVS